MQRFTRYSGHGNKKLRWKQYCRHYRTVIVNAQENYSIKIWAIWASWKQIFLFVKTLLASSSATELENVVDKNKFQQNFANNNKCSAHIQTGGPGQSRGGAAPQYSHKYFSVATVDTGWMSQSFLKILSDEKQNREKKICRLLAALPHQKCSMRLKMRQIYLRLGPRSSTPLGQLGRGNPLPIPHRPWATSSSTDASGFSGGRWKRGTGKLGTKVQGWKTRDHPCKMVPRFPPLHFGRSRVLQSPRSEQLSESEGEKVDVGGDGLRLQRGRAAALEVARVSADASEHHQLAATLDERVERGFVGRVGQTQALDRQPRDPPGLHRLRDVEDVDTHAGRRVSAWWRWRWEAGSGCATVSRLCTKLVLVAVQCLELAATIFHCVRSDRRHPGSRTCCAPQTV